MMLLNPNRLALRAITTVVVAIAVAAPTLSQSVTFRHENAVVWALNQEVRGVVAGADEATLFLNEESVDLEVVDGSFTSNVRLGEGENVLVACSGEICSDTLRWTLGYVPRPEVLVVPEVEGRNVTLRASVLENPLGHALEFEWVEDPENPAQLALSATSDSLVIVAIPEDAPVGEYYFDLIITDESARSRRARTFVTVLEDVVVAFDISRDHASWVDEAVLYEIAPWYFARNCSDKFACIEDKIAEIAALGVTAIWLQPTYPTAGGGQAYDVTDYFGIWSALGDEASLRSLIQEAKSHGLKVMFDFVPNHSSIQHPYAQDAIEHGETSHYWDFYMREFDGTDVPYSNNYKSQTVGEMTFVWYFWEDLVTFNYQNPETQRYIMEASRYWIEEFDIDGYRLDAVWGPHARNPGFMHEWRRAMKRVKPEILLLAEDKAARPVEQYPPGFPSTFENFDVAYDWTDDYWCISQWAWARNCEYQPDAYGSTGSKRTIFNSVFSRARAESLSRAITNDGDGYHEDAKILRFIENNDTPRFIGEHSLEQTRLAAAIMFSLHGVPMLYYGQEAGLGGGGGHPWPTIPQSATIRSLDSEGLWPYYQHLIDLRRTYQSLHSDNFAEVELHSEDPTGQVYAYRRWHEDENIIGVANLATADVRASLALPVEEFVLDESTTYYLTDLLTGDYIETDVEQLDSLDIQIEGNTARLYALADSVISITVSNERPVAEMPREMRLHQNYPNPFNPQTTIAFELPVAGAARLDVYDMLGRRVASLVEGDLASGRHEVSFDGRGLASGTYIYRLQAGDRVETMRMVLVK